MRSLGQIFFLLLVLGLGFLSVHAEPIVETTPYQEPGHTPINAPNNFLISLYRAPQNGEKRDYGMARAGENKRTDIETIQVANNEAGFIGSAQEIPVPVLISGTLEQREKLSSGTKIVEYHKVENGIEVRPTLMGHYVQVNLILKNDHYDPESKVIQTQEERHTVTVPMGQWVQVVDSAKSDDSQSYNDYNEGYGTALRDDHILPQEELWIKVELLK